MSLEDDLYAIFFGEEEKADDRDDMMDEMEAQTSLLFDIEQNTRSDSGFDMSSDAGAEGESAAEDQEEFWDGF